MAGSQAATVETEEETVNVEPREKPGEKPREETRTKKQPPYAVILHNDDINGFGWVVGILAKVLPCSRTKALWLTMKVHRGGRGLVWAGSLEVAELKAEQIRGAGPDPQMAHRGARQLKVTVEKMPK